jgi:hypothetical protein
MQILLILIKFYQMKKGLLSILAGALLVVGCQNYDDQFDDLNSQITALASQVAGLAKVQSDLTTLSGTVASLQGNIATSVDTALASGLAGINATVTTLEAAIEGIATTGAVTELATSVAAAQTDLTELLNNSNVFTGNLTISTPSQLSAALAFGTKINIVNGSVNITHETTMDADSIQKVVNRIITVVGDLKYMSQASTIKEVTFNNLTGVTSLTAQGVGYSFPNLESATNVYLYDTYKSKVKVIAFDKLATVVSLNTDLDKTHKIEFNKATNIHLTALKRYPSAALTLRGDEGLTLKLDALDNVDATGLKTSLALTIEGPSTVSYTKFTKGSITLKNVAQATVDNHTGTLTLQDGVTSFTSNSVVALDITAATDLETLDITGVVNPLLTAATQTAGLPAIAFATANDLTTVTLKGKFLSASFASCGNLATVTISADIKNAVSLTSNTDLVTLNLTDSKMSGLTFTGNTDMETLTVNTTFQAGTAASAKLDGSLTVKANTSLTKLVVSSDKIETLDVQDNDDLATLDFAGLTTFGATAKPNVKIYDNDLTATAVDSSDGLTDIANGATGDIGSWTTTSGMASAKIYLLAVAGSADSTAAVYWDTVESFTNEALAETTDKLWAAGAYSTILDEVKILYKVPNAAAAAIGSTKHKVAWLVSGMDATDRVQIQTGAADSGAYPIFLGGSGVTYTNSGIALTGNKVLDLALITNSNHVTRAAAVDMTLTAALGGGMGNNVVISTVSALGVASGTVYGERYTTAAALTAAVSSTNLVTSYGQLLNTDDYVTLTVGSNSVTATGVSTDTLGNAITAAWLAKYGPTGTASASAVASVTSVDTARSALVISAINGTAGNGLAISMSVTASGTVNTGTNAEGVEWVIGSTRSAADNLTISDNIIVTLESTVAGVLLDKIKLNAPRGVATACVITQLTTTLLSNSVGALESIAGYQRQTGEARADTRLPEDGASAGASTAASFSRVGWFS